MRVISMLATCTAFAVVLAQTIPVSGAIGQDWICGAADSLEYSPRMEAFLQKSSPATFNVRAIFVDFADNPNMLYTDAMAEDLWTDFQSYIDRQSRGNLSLDIEVVRDPSAPEEVWTAFEIADRYASGQRFGDYPRYSSYWASTSSFWGELQAEMLLKIQAAYAGLDSPFDGADLIVFLYLPDGLSNPIGSPDAAKDELHVKHSMFPILANAATDPRYPSGNRPSGHVVNWWGDGEEYTKYVGTLIAHEFGHAIGLQHPLSGMQDAVSVCGSAGATMAPHYYGPYNLMRRTILESYPFQPLYEDDLVRLGWLNRVVINANSRNVLAEDIRSGGNVYYIDGLDPMVANIGGALVHVHERFSIALHAGAGDDGRIVPAGGTMYKSTGLAIWHSIVYRAATWPLHVRAVIPDLESAYGMFDDPDGRLGPNPATGYDNLDVEYSREDECAKRDPVDAMRYPGSAIDFVSGIGSEFSYRSNPNTAYYDNEMSGPYWMYFRWPFLAQDIPNSIVVRIREDYGSAMLVDILLAPYEDVTSPNGGEILQVGQPYAVTWDKEFTIDQPAGIINTVDIYCSRGEGYDDQLIASGVDATLGSYQWTPAAAHVSQTCKIRIVYHNVNDAAHVGEDESDGEFIVADLTEAKFTDVSSQTGISYTGQPYSAVPGDFEADMKNDLMVAVTGAAMSLNRGTQVLPSGAPQFVPSSPLAGLTTGRGVAVADYDNDGDQDIFVAHATNPKLWRSHGGTYFDATAASGLASLASSSLAAAWGDYDRDGLLDLFVTRGAYLYSEPPSAMNISAAQPRLFRNLGNGSFADVTAAANLSGYMNACVSPNWGDIDGDGYEDIIALDLDAPTMLSTHLVFMNQGNGTFTEQFMTRLYHTGVNMYYVTGVVLEDMNNDGHLDIVYSSAGAGSSVCLNGGAGTFHGNQRILFPPLIGEVGTCYSGLQVFDHDLDGWKDVVLISTSNSTPSRSFSCVPTSEGVTFLENTAAVGLGGNAKAMGSAAADFTGDGDYDLFVGRAIADGQYFYKTDSKAGSNSLGRNYVKVRLASPLKANNRQGIGATVTVTAGDLVQTQAVDGGSGRGGQRDRDLIFGLGDYSGTVTATVKWPRGHVQCDVPLFVSGPATADSINTVVDQTMVISNLNAASLIVPGTTMFDWVFSWDTNAACDSSQDVLAFDQVGIQNPCWPGWTVLTPSTPGVVYSYEPKPGGGYLHQFTIYGQECNLNCSFRYSAFSAMGANQATSATKTKRVTFCPSDF